MKYNKTQWVEKETIITAEAMNNIENGIENANDKAILNESVLKEVNAKLDEKADIHDHPYANASHTHNKNEILDFPESLPANGGNADTVNGKTVEVNVPANAKFTDTVYEHPAAHDASMITENESKRFVSDTEKATWNAKADATLATTSANGLMSKAMVTKLNGIATGAQTNQNAFSVVKIGSTYLTADMEMDTLTLVAGNGISITGTASSDTVTISSTAGGSSSYEMDFNDGYYSIDMSTYERGNSVTVRKSGDVVMIEFTTLFNDGDERYLGQLKTGYRPGKKLLFCDGYGNNMNIGEDGYIQCTKTNDMGWISPVTFIAAQ